MLNGVTDDLLTLHWRGPKGSKAPKEDAPRDGEDVKPIKAETTKPPTFLPQPAALITAALLCLLLPNGNRWDSPSADSTLPQRILFEEPGHSQEIRPPALRGCCGAPTDFRWVFLDDSKEAVAGRPFRTRLLALDAYGRQARPADCGALRVDLGLTGKARLSLSTSPQAWRLSALELDIENEHAEVIQAEVRIESPNPAADVLLQSSQIHFASGPPHNFVMQMEDPQQASDSGHSISGVGPWPQLLPLRVRVLTQDRFGNRVPFATQRSGGSGLALRSNGDKTRLEMRPANGHITFDERGEGHVTIQGMKPGPVKLWLEEVGGNSTAQQKWDVKRRSTRTIIFTNPSAPPQPSVASEMARSTMGANDEKWRAHADEVKEAVLHAWRGYRSFAWGMDEVQPLSRSGRNSFGGVGITIIDSLTTLWLMGLDEQFEEAARFVSEELDFDRADAQISVFELTIRGLGGLLGAYALSGRKVFLDKAEDLGSRLLPAFNTSSRLPLPKWNIAKGFGDPSAEPTILSEVGSLQLEFRYLAAQTGKKRFKRVADEAFQAIESAGLPGLLPVYLTPPQQHPVKAVASKFAFGALADSYYEYLLKQWLQSPSEVHFKDLWIRVMEELGNLVRPLPTPSPEFWAVSQEVPKYKLIEVSARGEVLHKMDHLSCFTPAMVVLGLKTLPKADLAVKGRNATWWRLAEGLTESCTELWTMTKSGLAPEFSFVHPKEPYSFFSQLPSDGRHSFLRPETAESLFYLYRFTGDEKYRRYGLQLFRAILEHTKVEGGFASVQDVSVVPTTKIDEMHSFVMAETFKYLYLLFSPAAMLDLERFVLNTEGHPLPRATGASNA